MSARLWVHVCAYKERGETERDRVILKNWVMFLLRSIRPDLQLASWQPRRADVVALAHVWMLGMKITVGLPACLDPQFWPLTKNLCFQLSSKNKDLLRSEVRAVRQMGWGRGSSILAFLFCVCLQWIGWDPHTLKTGNLLCSIWGLECSSHSEWDWLRNI